MPASDPSGAPALPARSGAFCWILAGLAVGVRMVCFDYRAFFLFASIPNHDISQGAAFFATHMHSVRLFGDIAWWNPISNYGYAQYFQAFGSPLAPTPGHIAFIVWAEGIRLLALLGVAVPEYVQYLAITYVVLPFLCFAAFAFFLTRILSTRPAIVLVMMAYTLSGIGLWNSAWFYFQEQATLFFLLGSLLAWLQEPSKKSAYRFLAAILIQVASLNYWSVYDSWFLGIVAAAYCLSRPREVKRLGAFLRELWSGSRREVALLTGLSVATMVLWLVLLVSIVSEQGGNYSRKNLTASSHTIAQASGRIMEIRLYTIELFDPLLSNPFTSHPLLNPMHNARYIGATLLPFLAASWAFRWKERQAWLIPLAATLLFVCLGPPLLLEAWNQVPFMNRVVHLFYFYSHFWQIAIVLIAAASFESLLTSELRGGLGKRLAWTCALVTGVTFTALGCFAAVSYRFPAPDPQLQANLTAALLVLFVCGLMAHLLAFPGRRARMLLTYLTLLLTLGDLSRYFAQVSREDQRYTAGAMHADLPNPATFPLTAPVVAALKRPWPRTDPATDFTAGLPAAMPVPTDFWPKNTFMIHRDEKALQMSGAAAPSQEIAFFEASRQGPGGMVFSESEQLPISHRLTRWSYNGFDLEVACDRKGDLFLRQIADPCWRVTVDSVAVTPTRANFIGMALPLEPGRHRIVMDYRPRARLLYKPAALLLQLALISLMWASRKARR